MENLATLASQVIGTVLKPEMWIAVGAAIYFIRSVRQFFIVLGLAAVAFVALRYVPIPSDRISDMLMAAIAFGLCSSIGSAGPRVTIIRRRPPATAAE